VIAVTDLSIPAVARPVSIDRWTWRDEALGKVSASMAECSARLTRRRLNMNANETTAIRELTTEELDEVSGGFLPIALWLFAIGMGAGGGYSEVADGYTGW
jgi:lactobin A/cerein 7B family class IIb bacteriocin